MILAEQLACADVDAAWFEGVDGSADAKDRLGTVQEQRERAEIAARRWCSGCPSKAPCRLAADRRKEVGLWAGELRRIVQDEYLVVDLINPEDSRTVDRVARGKGRPPRQVPRPQDPTARAVA